MRQIPCAGPGPYDVSAPHRALRLKVRGPCVGHLRPLVSAPGSGCPHPQLHGQQRTRRSTTRPSLGGQNRRLDASSALASIIRQTHAPTFLAAGPSRPVRTYATRFNPPVPKLAAATIKRGVTPLTAGSATRAAPVQGVTQRPDALEGHAAEQRVHPFARGSGRQRADGP